MNDQELEQLYGPAAKFSDHARGEHITFTEEGKVYTGRIVWVCAPGEVTGKQMPTQYIVEGDQRPGFPHVVNPGDILESR